MNLTRAIVPASLLALLLAGCSSGPANCTEYADEIDAMIEAEEFDKLRSYLDDTGEFVAKQVTDNPTAARLCADAALEAMFTVGFAELDFDFEP